MIHENVVVHHWKFAPDDKSFVDDNYDRYNLWRMLGLKLNYPRDNNIVYVQNYKGVKQGLSLIERDSLV